MLPPSIDPNAGYFCPIVGKHLLMLASYFYSSLHVIPVLEAKKPDELGTRLRRRST